MLQTPISLRSSFVAAICSNVLTLTWYFGAVMVARMVLGPILRRYGLPGSMGSSAIHKMVVSNWSATSAGESAGEIRSPREMSISSLSVSVMDWPATARSRSPLCVTMRATVLSRPDGWTRMRSPGLMTPLAICPAKPRNELSGRFTHCIGRRKGWLSARSSTFTVSRCESRTGPRYQSMLELGSTMLSPFKAETGMDTISNGGFSSLPRPEANWA